MENQLNEYRNYLVIAEQKMQEEYDKTVLALSSGGLGVSLVFLKDVIGDKTISCKCTLIMCWVSWGLSVTVVLASYFFSHQTIRKTIVDFDTATKNSTLPDFHSKKAGGKLSDITTGLNVSSGMLFLVGLIFIAIFIFNNFGDQNAK